MAKKVQEEIRAEDLDFGERFVGENTTNPMFTSIFNQPAQVDSNEFEYRIINRSELHDFPNHPFKVTIDDEMLELRDSIIDNGILQPLIVIPRREGGYTIIAGHRRNKGAELAQLSSVPCIIAKNINDAQATIMMVDSNKQREVILPSERAFAYKMKMDALNHNGQRTLGTECPRLNSREQLAHEEGMGQRQISNYIRLTYLIPQLMDFVDNDILKESPSMALKPAVEISYLKPEEQKYFYDTVKALNKTPSVQQATLIKNLSKDGELTQTKVMEILIADKPNQRETVKVDYERLGGYFHERLTPKECEGKVFESLDCMAKIRAAVEKHVQGKTLTDNEMATLIDNLLGKYAKSHPVRGNEQIR